MQDYPKQLDHDVETESSSVLIANEGRVLILSINNPGKLNAIHQGVFISLYETLQEYEHNSKIAAVVINGAGGYFCSGGDLNVLRDVRQQSETQRRVMIEHLNELIRYMRIYPKPIIAAVEGGAAGAGMSIAFACDVIVAEAQANFTAAYVSVGLTPDGGLTSLLSELLPRPIVMQMCLSGEPVTGEFLHHYGAVNYAVAAESVMPTALELGQRMSYGPANAMQRIKSLVNMASSHTLEEQLALETQYMSDSQADPESGEGIEAFFAKRYPDYKQFRK